MRFISSFLSLFQRFWSFLKGLGTRQKWIAGVAAVIVIGGVGYALFGAHTLDNTAGSEDTTASVSLIPVSDFAENASSAVNTAGSETTVRAEGGGKVVSVLPVGTRVTSGTTIALFENASQQASLLQAEGSLEAAQANLDKVTGGIRSEKLAILQAAYASAESGAVTTLLSAYATVDSSVRDTSDQMFSNPESNSPKLSFTTSNNQRAIAVENERAQLSNLLTREANVSASVSTDSDLEAELDATETEIRDVRAFIDDLIASLNEAIPTGNVTASTISGYKTSATAARTALTGALSSIASSRAALETASQNLDEGLAGAESTDISAARAAVKQAQGAYNAALAAYRKTVVSAGVAGTIVSCNAAVGDVLSVGSDICRIRTSGFSSSDTFILPLSSVKYSPSGASVFIVSEDGTLQAVTVTTGLVSEDGITTSGLLGDEYIVRDVRGLKVGDAVHIQ